jgi:hypothetical protein
MSRTKHYLHLDEGEIPKIERGYSEGAVWINIGDEISIFFSSLDDRENFVDQLHKEAGTSYWNKNREAA